MVDDATSEQEPVPDKPNATQEEQIDQAIEADAPSEVENGATPRTPGGVKSGWLREMWSRLPVDTSVLRALPSTVDSVSIAAPNIPADALSRAVRAGEMIVALAPGAPMGLVAPEGVPRVAPVIGRDERLAEAVTFLERGASLCIHSSGAPGAGKSTFAAEVIAQLAERKRFPGGIVWISCEALGGDTGLAEVVSRVAHGLHVDRALAALDPEERRVALAEALGASTRLPTVLALATIEPTLDISALLDTLAGPSISLMLTSLHSLEDPRVESFTLPPLASDDAARLFALRLRLRDARRPVADEEPLIAQVSQALGGLPLALGLGAAAVGAYGLTLETAMEEAQVDGARGPAAALRARIDRLWQALVSDQQRTLAGLTLISGATFPRAAALAVARAALASGEQASDSDDTLRWRAAQTLDALIGLGAVEAMAAGRLRLHPQVRKQLASRLGALPEAMRQALGEAMADWWLDYARSHQGYEGVAGLEVEAAGLMGALTWAHAHASWRRTLDLAESFGDVWRTHGRRAEALRIAHWAVEAAEADGQPRERHWARYQLAVAQTEAGMLSQAIAGFTEALAIAREIGDPLAIRDGAHALAALAARTGDVAQARASFTEALLLAREMNDPVSMRDELHGLAILDAQANRLYEARLGYTEALAIARGLDDHWAIYLERYGLALVEMRAGDIEQARRGFVEALALAKERGDDAGSGDVLVSLGALDAQRGELALALDELSQAVALAQQRQDARRGARALVWLAQVEYVNGDADMAIAHYQQAHAIYERLGDAEAQRVAEQLQALSNPT
ncbi:MAG TPA: hypothetical protein VF792_11585 [Ktedonobacterales bacterium]